MPLPWKKSKIARVSRFVSDLKSSSKHGESLVVETGFPTSLIDLIVKNRDRFRKPSKKKKQFFSSSSSLEISSPNSPPPPPRALSIPLHPLHHIPPSSSSNSNSNSATMLMVPSSPSSIEPIIKCHFSSSTRPKKGFMLILKLFFVLILALGTKKIAIVITISAFVLLLVEFAGKNLLCFMKPCSDAKESLNSVIDSILVSNVPPEIDGKIATYKDNNLIEQEETVLVDNSSLNEDNNGAKIMADEVTMNEEIQIEPGFDSLHCGCRWGFADSDQKKRTLSSLMKDEGQLIDDANIISWKKKGSVKFNPNMLKKFVTKKLRGSKKKRNGEEESYLDSNNEFVLNYPGEDNEKLNRVEYQEQEDDQGLEEGDGEDDDDDEDQVHGSSDFSQIELESDVGANVGANAGNITIKSLKQLIPFVMVLVGLIGGRIIALVLTISWYLLVNLVFRTAMRN